MKTRLNKKTFQEPVDKLFEALDVRSQDIVKRRFGLETGSHETLESIGKEYGITRERVRQIEAHARKILRTRLDYLQDISGLFEEIFRDYGGILPEDQIVGLVNQALGEAPSGALVNFYLDLLPPYEYTTNDPVFVTHWRHTQIPAPHAADVVNVGRTILSARQAPTHEHEFITQVCSEIHTPNNTPTPHVHTWLSASRHICKNPFGEWGLAGWAEMTPRGVGDKAYAVLRRHGTPEHFRRIAEMINEAHFDRKVANAQTVHNELIKDKRFVLVGRGLYGLSQWGYVPGTVADVVESILRDSKQPLTRDEIIDKVLAQRMVKKNTILLSLQDHSRFIKTTEGRYTLKK